jgi:hypothetical protein
MIAMNWKWIFVPLNDRRCQAQLMCLPSMMIDWNLKWICVPSMIAATKLRWMCLPSMMIAWTWSGSMFPQWSQIRSSDECVCPRWWLPELEVDLCAFSDISYEAQVNVFALDDDCLNLKWICVPLMIAATKLRWLCLSSMMIAWTWSGSVFP